MRDEALISMQGTIVRIACQRMRTAYLKTLSDSVQQAACLPDHLTWDRKAAAPGGIRPKSPGLRF